MSDKRTSWKIDLSSVITQDYRTLLPRMTFTSMLDDVELSIDNNPWHSHPVGLRARLRKLRRGAWWTFQRRVLRRHLPLTTEITIPNCRVTNGENPA